MFFDSAEKCLKDCGLLAPADLNSANLLKAGYRLIRVDPLV